MNTFEELQKWLRQEQKELPYVDGFVESIFEKIYELEAHPDNDNKVTESDLVSFGSYLLSQERDRRITFRENIRMVHDADIQNWKHLKDNIKNQ